MKKTISTLLLKVLPYSIGLAVVLLIPALSFAQSTGINSAFVPLTNIPGLTSTGTSPTLPIFFNQIYKICIGAAAGIAVLQIMRAGFLFMTNKGSVSGNEQAKSLISQSILGLVLVLSPVIVFGIINPDILKLDLDVSGLQTSTTSWATSTSTTATNTTTTYLLAYYSIAKDSSGNNVCYIDSVKLYADAASCATGQQSAPGALQGTTVGTATFGAPVIVKACEATTQTSYTVTAPTGVSKCS